MHIVFFRNGYANQLFQLCLYFKLLEKYKNDVYAIGATSKFISSTKELFFRKFIKIIYKLPKKVILVNEKNYDNLNIVTGKNYFYVGEFQSSLYFPKNMEFINQIFNVENLSIEAQKIYKKIIENPSIITLHVRRGDYVNSTILSNVTNKNYFDNCLKYICNKLQNPKFLVFSDDIKWCKEKLQLPQSTIYIDSFKQFEDIFLISQSKYKIISNSTYSWWGKTINNKFNKLVLAPKYWFNYKIIAKPLYVGDCVLIDNFVKYKTPLKKAKITLIYFVNNKEKNMVNSSILSLMNQEETSIQILVVIKKDDKNLKLINYYARLDRRIKKITLSSFKFYFKKISFINCIGDYIVPCTSTMLLKPEFCNKFDLKYNAFKNHAFYPDCLFFPKVKLFKKMGNLIIKNNKNFKICYLSLIICSIKTKLRIKTFNLLKTI